MQPPPARKILPPMPARYPQVPDNPNVFHAFSKRLLQVFFRCSLRCRGDADQRFPNNFDVGGFPKRTIKYNKTNVIYTFLPLNACFSNVYGRTFFQCFCWYWCYVFLTFSICFFNIFFAWEPRARTYNISPSLALGPSAGPGPASAIEGDNSKATTNGAHP